MGILVAMSQEFKNLFLLNTRSISKQGHWFGAYEIHKVSEAWYCIIM